MRSKCVRWLGLVLILGSAIQCSDSAEVAKVDEDKVQYFESGADFAGSHILVAYQGSERATPDITRSKEEAREKAQELIAQLKRDPSNFAEVARTESDGPSKARGGSLGSWQKGRMVPEFDAAMETLEVGEITPEPVETAFGYHVIIRQDTRQALWAGWGLVVAWDGATQITPRESRTKEQARELAAELQTRLESGNFEAESEKVSDTGPDPTFIGPFSEEAMANPITAELLTTLKPLDYGEIGGPVETPSGFLFLKRIELEQRAGSHILVAYQGAQGADESVTRSKDEALGKARELIDSLKTDPAAFSNLARQESDGPSSRNGGDLGVWFKGRMTPEFDRAVDQMQVEEISSEPVETPFGFHVIRRKAVDTRD